jgi:hypothetical protein
MYSGTSLQVKLKKCLYDYYVNKGLKYVLLGGDDTIIPVMGCYGYVSAVDSTYIDNNIPTDLFYACFDGDFEWNANGNEIYGELSDNINLLPSIYLTRVPIRSETDVNAFAKKLLAYETNPLDYSNTMLMCGCQMNAPYELDSTKSDAEAAGYTLYSEYIKPNWDGKMFRLYDTISDFGYNEEDINLNLNHFQEQLSMGYGFVDMITHGNIDLWALENGSYNAKNALSLISKGSSIITTNSCSTNAFDNTKDPCLSEAFIRNPDSGIIAYLGSSRYSWIYVGGTGRLGVSLQYESAFYDNLFKSSFEEKEFGKIVADAKSKYAGVSCTNNAYRWIQFSLNPIGDPEMPIYTDTPKVFDNVHVDFYGDNLNVETNVEGCRVCVSSSVDNGDSYYHVEYDTDRFTLSDVSQSITVCITKQGYVPYVKTFEHILYIQNMLITGPQNYESDIIKIGSNVTNTMETGPVVFENGEISIKGKSVTIEGGTEVDKQTILKITNK